MRVIGRGGMGTVYEARHTQLGQRVAIKVLGDGFRAHPELVRRFEREARAAGALSSPHAARIFDIDQDEEGTPFIVMELLEGRDLGRVIEEDGPQPIGLAVRWVIEACHAIEEAHGLGIVHRDIKPANLLLCDSGSIKVLDFGIAKNITSPSNKDAGITQGLAPLGTPQYMSPEQVRSAKDVDRRTDIWSLGTTLYELLTGQPPFNHEVALACIAAIVADPVPDPRALRPELPDALAEAILHALEKNLDDRFADVDALVAALEPFAAPSTCNDASAIARSTPSAMPRRAEGVTFEFEEEIVLELQPLRKQPDDARRTRSKRLRSSFAVVSAAMLGIAALVGMDRYDAVERPLSPAYVGGANARVSNEQVSARERPPATAPMLAPTIELDAPTAAAAAGQSSPKSDPPPTPERVTATPVAPGSAAPAPSHMVRPVRLIGDTRPVHGGISNPGF